MEERCTTQQVIECLESLIKGVDPVSGQAVPAGQASGRNDMIELCAMTVRLLGKEPDYTKEELILLFQAETGMNLLKKGLDLKCTLLPDGCVLKQEQMLENFSYAARILQDRLCGYRIGIPREGIVYALPPRVVRRRTLCSRELVPLKKFVKQLNNMLGFFRSQDAFYIAVRDWLQKEGYTTNTGFGEDGPLVTSRGEAVGLLEQPNEYGTGMGIFCGGKGQRFLLDALEQILAFWKEQWEAVEACLTPEFIAGISCGDKPVSLTGFLNCINDQLPSGLIRKFTAVGLNSWMVRQGLKEDIFVKRWRRVSTDVGEAMGIGTVPQGSWKEDNHLTREGQCFILSHLRDIARDLGSGEAYQTVPLEFSMPEELPGRFSYSGYMSHVKITEWLNAELWPAVGIRLPQYLVAEWMIDRGFLEQASRPGGPEEGRTGNRTVLIPTGQGTAIGLTMAESEEDQPYTVYSEAVQRYVVQHLEEIMAFWRDL